MDKERLYHSIVEELTKRLGSEFNVTINEVHKTNIKLDGLSISKVGENIAPVIYLNRYLGSAFSFDEIVADILNLYTNAKEKKIDFDLSSFCSFNNIKEKLFIKLVNKSMNEELLSTIPHMDFLDDFAMTFHVVVIPETNEFGSISITNSHMKMWDITTELLYQEARLSMRKLFEISLTNIVEVIDELSEHIPDDITDNRVPAFPMWVLSNTSHLYGATGIIYEDILLDFAKEHGDFFVLFSSIHECLFVESKKLQIDDLTRMNVEVNNTMLAPVEILGTVAYFYDSKTGLITKNTN